MQTPAHCPPNADSQLCFLYATAPALEFMHRKAVGDDRTCIFSVLQRSQMEWGTNIARTQILPLVRCCTRLWSFFGSLFIDTVYAPYQILGSRYLHCALGHHQPSGMRTFGAMSKTNKQEKKKVMGNTNRLMSKTG